jgi:sensor histidine kinase YesM
MKLLSTYITSLKRRFNEANAKQRASLPPDVLRDIDAFNAYIMAHKWKWIIVSLMVWIVAAVALKLSLTKLGWIESAVVTLIMMTSLAFGLMSVWFGSFKIHMNSSKVIGMVMLAVCGAGSGWAFGVWMKRGEFDLMAELARNGSHVLTAGLVAGVCYTVLVSFTLMLRRRQLQERNTLLQQQAKEERYARQLTDARLKLMQAQVEPHFLFNTLATVQELAESRAPEAAALTRELIIFLRAGLIGLREERTTVAREFEMARAYLAIMQTRMGQRLQVEIDLPDDLANFHMPPAMLISLVENSIKHGIEPSVKGGWVRVFAAQVASLPDKAPRFIIGVADSGCGLTTTATVATTATKKPIEYGGLGLTNIRERLAVLYADNATLTITENNPQGVIATITLPLVTTE